jgi:DNA adenine methylase
MTYNTPLRYPGGKAKLAPFVRAILRENHLTGGHYAEAYAGGAGIAFELLFLECSRHVHLNDSDRAVYAFWHTVLNETEWLSQKISDTSVTIAQWRRQRNVYRARSTADLRELGFALLYLNRTNRSGILTGGVIGGLDQTGEWKIDARYNKTELVRRIEKIASFKSRISVYNLDAMQWLREKATALPPKTLVYLDPPYFLKGRRLYQNHYDRKDHSHIASVIQNELKHRWIVSYDNVPEIAALYCERRQLTYDLNYSAAKALIGTEVMFFSDNVRIPKCRPAAIPPRQSASRE